MRNESLEDLIDADGDDLQAIAERARIGRTSLWRWINGVAFPRHAQAAALALALGVKAERVIAAAERSAALSA